MSFYDDRVLQAAERIRCHCKQETLSLRPLPVIGSQPNLARPADNVLLPADLIEHITHKEARTLLTLAQQRIGIIRNQLLAEHARSASRVSQVDGVDGQTAERALCSMIENQFARTIEALASLLRKTIAGRTNRSNAGSEHRKSSGFPPGAVEVLETAFAHSDTLTTRECTVVAEAAGISHQQVRTWNKRNRGNRKSRIASTSALNDKVTEQIINGRRVASLPTKAKRQPQQAQKVVPSQSRATKSLPRRKTPAASPSDSLSSLDSIPPSGGFISPYQDITGQPTICFPQPSPATSHDEARAPRDNSLPVSAIELDTSAYLWFHNGYDNSGIMVPTLAESPSIGTIGSVESRYSDPADSLNTDYMDTLGDHDLFQLINNLFDDVGVKDDLGFDVDCSGPGARSDPRREAFDDEGMEDFGSTGDINVDDLTGFFDPDGIDEMETTAQIYEVSEDLEQVTSPARNAPYVLGDTEVVPLQTSSKADAVPSTAIQTAYTGSPTIALHDVEMNCKGEEPLAEQTRIAAGCSSTPPFYDDRSITSILVTDSTPSAAAHRSPLSETLSAVDLPMVSASPSQPINHSTDQRTSYSDDRLSILEPNISMYPHQRFQIPPCLQERSSWIQGALPFDTQLTWAPDLYQVITPSHMVSPAEEWVIIPRSSIPSTYRGAVVAHPGGW